MFCRKARSSRGFMAVTFLPSSVTRPEVGSISRSSSLPSVDFPQPDSPTSDSVSPG